MKPMRLIPSKEIIICQSDEQQKTSSGLILADSKKDKPEMGVIVKIGLGKLPLKVKIGDRIVFRRYTDNKVLIDAMEYNFIQFKDILGVIK